jgi:hypothetical protein
MKVFVRALSAVVGIVIATLGLGVSYDCWYLYLQEMKSPFWFPPVWKTAAILILLVLTPAVSLFAAYKFFRFAVLARK